MNSRSLLLAVLLTLALFVLAPAQEKSVKPGINDPFKDPDVKDFLGKFETESREIYTLRKEITQALKLKPGMAVADIGAGTGLYTRLFAKDVGDKGTVFAVDIAQKFLDHIKKTCAADKITNVKTIRCSQESCELEANTIDLAFVCDTYHHFEFPARTLASIHKALKKDGQLVIIDFIRIDGKSRDWVLKHVRAGQETVEKEIIAAGFEKLKEDTKLALKENYLVRFKKVEPKEEKPKEQSRELRQLRKQGKQIEFNRDIRPILSDRCFTCHGPDKAKRKGGLRLDTAEGGKHVVDPTKPDESELIDRITSDDSKVMPPKNAGPKLTASQIETLKAWIRQGAKWQDHWAYVVPKRPSLPEVSDDWSRNLIDQHVLARLEREGIRPSAEAPRHTLIRRLTYDLTGLPPTPEEVRAFVNDESPYAYERLVDRLLSSPRLGERLAYDWLDSARYADSNGFQADRDRSMWPWRDWAIRAFNSNMRFDRFTVEQLAGDLLPNSTTQQKIATGFNRNHMLNGEGGRVAEESRVDYVNDRIETMATVWLGLTLSCAKCHDHKYDPFTMKDYYRLFAYFNNITETGSVDRAGSAAPVLDFASAEQKEKRTLLEGEVAKYDKLAREAFDQSTKDFYEREFRKKRRELNELNSEIVLVMVMEERAKPRDTHVLIRGAWDKPGDKVTAGVIERLGMPVKGEPNNRLGLARWLVSRENPLTARVIVNRYWQLIFGNGLVRTSEDFGVQGELPSHPELLDHLAVEFQESGWDLKALLRLMLTSATYRQSSVVSEEMQEKDPENRLLARSPRYRLSSHAIRDQALAISGLLVERVGGAPVKPYQPAGIWEEMSFGGIKWKQSTGNDLYRRSLYTFWRRTVAPTNLFDTPARQVCVVRPSRTNTPLHALITLNDPTYVEAARVMAQRVLSEPKIDTVEGRIIFAFRLATGREPDKREMEVLMRARDRLTAHYQDNPDAARRLIETGDSPVETDRKDYVLATYTGVCSLILNLDEVLTRE